MNIKEKITNKNLAKAGLISFGLMIILPFFFNDFPLSIFPISLTTDSETDKDECHVIHFFLAQGESIKIIINNDNNDLDNDIIIRTIFVTKDDFEDDTNLDPGDMDNPLFHRWQDINTLDRGFATSPAHAINEGEHVKLTYLGQDDAGDISLKGDYVAMIWVTGEDCTFGLEVYLGGLGTTLKTIFMWTGIILLAAALILTIIRRRG